MYTGSYLMKFKNFILPALLLSALSTQAYSYVVYNRMPVSVHVNDMNFGGMEVTIPINSSAPCNPDARGCYGNMNFKVTSSTNVYALCNWSGKLPQGNGFYFIISPTYKSWPFNECRMDLFRD